MEVFIQFLKDNMALVVMTGIAVLGIIGVSATLITLKIKSKLSKNKTEKIANIAEAD